MIDKIAGEFYLVCDICNEIAPEGRKKGLAGYLPTMPEGGREMIWWIIGIWLSLSIGFVAGTVWTGFFKEGER